MWFTVLLIILLLLSLAILGWLLWKKWPQLLIVDPASSKESRSKQLKYELMRQRVERASGKQVEALNKGVFQPIGKGVQNLFRRVAGKLTAVERSYQERQKKEVGSKMDPETMKRLMSEGKKFMDEESWDEAEKRFIEVISNDAKNVEAYEKLGRLYLYKKDYELAGQTFQFLTKLSPEDPSVIAALGEVEVRLGNDKKAYTQFKKAHKLSPNNPKYLDFFIESAIAVREKLEAYDALEQLKKVNPQNKKIESFTKQISDIDMIKERPKAEK